MSVTVSTKTVSGEANKGFSILNDAIRRPLNIDPSWTKVAVMLKFGIDYNANISATSPILRFGLMSGTGAPPGQAGCEHFVGIQSTGGAMINGDNTYFTIDCITAKIENGSATTAGSNLTGFWRTCSTQWTTSPSTALWVLLVEKGSPNYKVTAIRSRVSDNAGPIDNAGFALAHNYTWASAPAGFGDGVRDQTIAIDAGTYGAFDSLVFQWASPTIPMWVDDISWYRLA